MKAVTTRVLLGGLGIAGVCTSVLHPTLAQAQTEPESDLAIQEVTVTARKREESLQSVPIAMNVLDSTALKAARIDDVQDVVTRIPGAGINQPYKNHTVIAIRGASTQDDNPGVDQSVNTFVDGVYIGTIAAVEFDLLDLERVEVLRGPQGTLFGRNTTGGAINFITRDPDENFRLNGSLTLGNYDQQEISASVSGELRPGKVFGSLAGKTRDSAGYVRNVFTGNMLGQDDQTSARGKLRFTPGERWDIVLSGDVSYDRTYGIPRYYVGDFPQSLTAQGIVLPTRDDETLQDRDGNYDRKIYGIAGVVKVDTDIGGVTSITSYREHRGRMNQWDGDATPAKSIDGEHGAATISQFSLLETFSQEVRLDTKIGERFDVISGLYYLDQSATRNERMELGGAAGSFIAEILMPNTTEASGQVIDTSSVAAFFDGTMRITQRFSLSAGFRWTDEEKSGTQYCLSPGLICGGGYDTDGDGVRGPGDGTAPWLVNVGKSWSEPTWRVTGSFQATQDAMFYAGVSKGFKSGGFFLPEFPQFAGQPYDPEFALSYELGMKSEWLNRRLRVNATAFFVKYDDLQFLRFVETGYLSGNIGAAENKGLELELTAVPFRNANVWMDYVYQDSEYTDGTIVSGSDFTGNQIQLTPKNSLTLGGTYELPLGEMGALRFTASMVQKSRQFDNASNILAQSTEFKDLYNARISFVSATGRWEASLWGNNLADKRNRVGANNLLSYLRTPAEGAAGYRSNQLTLTPPRMYGVTFTWNVN